MSAPKFVFSRVLRSAPRRLWLGALLLFVFASASLLVHAQAVKRQAQKRSAAPLSNSPQSVKTLTQVIASLRAKEKAEKAREDRDKDENKDEKARDGGVKEVKRGPEPDEDAQGDGGLDALGALLYFLAPRAFPNDTVDGNAYDIAVAQRDQMPAAKLGRAASPRRKPGERTPSIIGGSAWEFLGPNNFSDHYISGFGTGAIAGRVNAIATVPGSTSTYYVGAAGGGVWKTTNNGTNWTPLSDRWLYMNVSSLAVDPSNANIVYAGTGDFDGFDGHPFGIMKSMDGGATWVNQGRAEFGTLAVSAIVVDPETPTTVTVTTGRGNALRGFVWRSTDSGATWNRVINTGLVWSGLTVGAADGSGQRYYYAAGYDTNTAVQVYRSADRGATWTQLTSPATGTGFLNLGRVAASPADPSTVYLVAAQDTKIWKSTNAGASWTVTTSGSLDTASWNQGWYDLYVTCGSQSVSGVARDVVYVGLLDIYQSINGANFTAIDMVYTGSDVTHTDQHTLVVNPANAAADVLVGNDGGVARMQYDAGAGAWTSASGNAALGITQFYNAAFYPNDARSLMGGAQDNGTIAARGDFSAWHLNSGGDGGYCAINPLNINIQYGSYVYLTIFQTLNAWGRYTDITPNIGSDNVAFIAPFALDMQNPNLLYGATNYLYRHDDATGNWANRLANQLLSTNSYVQCVAIAPSDGNRIYTGSTDGELWMTTDAGASWTRIDGGSPGLPGRAIMAIQVNATNPSKIMAGLSGTGTGHLWACDDTTAGGGRVWRNISGSGATALPDISLNAIALDIDSPDDTFYVGTDVGVFATSDSGATWSNATAPLGLPNVQINDLKSVPGTHYLNAVTYGRGIWRIPLIAQVSLTGLTLAPTVVTGGQTSTGTVTLNNPAPSPGSVVTLSSDNGAATTPATVTIPTGARSATFTVSTTPVAADASATIRAALNGVTQTAALQILAPRVQTIAFNPNPVKGGLPSTGTVTLNGRAAADVTVTLSSADSATASVPASVTVLQGQSSATFPVTTGAVTSTTDVVITTTLRAQTTSGTLTVFAFGVASVTLNPNTVRGGQSSTGTVTLSDPAPAGGATVTLSASPTSAAAVPATVGVAAGATTATFTVTTNVVAAPTNVTVTATLNRVSQTAVLRVNPPALASVSLNPTAVLGGQPSTGTVTIDGAAPTGGLTVTLSSGNTNVAAVPNSVTIAAGRTNATFPVSTLPVAGVTTVTISATSNGVTRTASLRIAPPDVYALSVNPSSVYGGATSTGTVRLNGAAPASGIVVTLSSSNAAAATPPANVTVPSGATSANFNITTRGVSVYTTVTISASANGQTRTASLNVVPNTLRFVTLNPTAVRGGVSSTGTVTLTGPASTGGAVVSLSSGNTAVAQTPTSVTVRAGQTSATFTVTTTGVTSVQNVAIRAALGGATVSATLSVSPTNLSGLSISPDTVVGTQSATGLIRLDGPAPEGGLTVTLSSSNPSVAGVPTTVTVPEGLQTKTFTIITSAVTARTQVTITARAGSVTVRATLTVDIPRLRTLTIQDAQGNPVTTIAGGNPLVGKVTISNPAPAGGIVVQLSSSDPAVFVPASVTISQGQASATFTIGTARVLTDTPVVLTATAGGVTVTAGLTLQPLMLSSLTLLPSTVLGGNSSLAIVALNGPAPQGGVRVSLQSSSQALTTQPAFVIIPAGASMSSVYILTQPVDVSTDVTITASASVFGGNPVTQTATLTIVPPTLLSLSVSPSGLRGGQSAQGSVTLSGLSPFARVTLTSSNPTVVQVPAFVFIFPGQTSSLFDIQTTRVTTPTTVTLTATYNGTTRTTTIRVNP